MTKYDFDLNFVDEAAEPEVVYAINRELQLAMRMVEETGANLFLTGRAGTGKTTFLKKLRETSSKRMVVLAPTGVAAINAGGNTIHSFFQLPFSPYIPGKGFAANDRKYLNVSRQKHKLISSLSLLIIDEISMVRPDTLDAIDSILRRLRNSSLPFGGLQLLLIGDLRQLPPVVREPEWALLKDRYTSPYFFESHALKKAGFHAIELSMVYRQSDREFLDILNSIRDGHATSDTLRSLNSRYIPSFNPDDSEGYIRLTTHNRSANDINRRRLNNLSTPEYRYEASIQGDFPESAYPAEKSLALKVGAQVMFVKNDTGYDRRYYNGLIGIVTELDENSISVKPLGRNDIINVEPALWENTRFTVEETSGAILQDVTGTFTQYPLQTAWAITIHKSQGLTFDRAIIDAANSFAPGQTYVALSRCRSLGGLVLDSLIPERAIITDGEINEFIDYCGRNTPDTSMVESLKSSYLHQLLAELFDFEPLKRAFADFERNALEYIAPMHPEIFEQFLDWRSIIADKLCAVGRKFVDSRSGQALEKELLEPHSVLKERIKNGCGYFIGILEDFHRFLHCLPNDIDNAEYAKRLNNTFNTLDDILTAKSAILRRLSKENFGIRAYLDAKSLASLEAEGKSAMRLSQPNNKLKSASGASETKKPREKKKPKGYSAFETLRLYNEGKTIEEIASERDLTVNTIARHIAQLIQIGRIEFSSIISPELEALLSKVVENLPEATFSELLTEANRMKKGDKIPSYILKIYKAIKVPYNKTGTKSTDE